MERVAAIAIINDHHMLMGKRRDNGRWTNPGGHLNPGESPVKGAAREVEEETGIKLDPHLFKHIETRIVKKKDGKKIEVHGFRVDLRQKPSTSMKQDPDGEVHRWHWIKLDTELDHIQNNLHVPLGDNVLLDNILKEKVVRRHIQRFWNVSKKVGVNTARQSQGIASRELPQQYVAHKNREEKQKTAAELVVGGKADGKPASIFPKDQIAKGVKVEREHTNNPAMAKEIAKDHLTEDKKYYTHLKEMEDKHIQKKAFWSGFMRRRRLKGLPASAATGPWFPDHDDIDHVEFTMAAEDRYPELSKYTEKRWDELPKGVQAKFLKAKKEIDYHGK
jgi:8-oxo-dGTP pyrophosphatase MutT (NUDIX family)